MIKRSDTPFLISVVCAVVTVFVVAFFAGLVWSSSPPEADQVAKYYVEANVGFPIEIVKKENVSTEIGAVEAYRFTVKATGQEGTAQVIVAKTNSGAYAVVVPQSDPSK